MKESTHRSQFTHMENTVSSSLSSMASIISAGVDVGMNGVCHIADGYGLEPHTARAGQYGLEQAFATEEDVLCSLILLNIHPDGGFKSLTHPN